jgi:hypothetical protein
MRNISAIFFALLSMTSIGCDVILQPSAQGEWSDFHNAKHRVTKDVATPHEKPAAEK